MSKFEAGDKVVWPARPDEPIEVLEVVGCGEEGCDFGDSEVFRSKDPGGEGDRWMHIDAFEKVA